VLRLFLALHPPLEAAHALLGRLEGLELPAHRRTPIDQLHLTVLFVGDTPERELDAVIESVERAAAGVTAFELVTRGLVALPERGPARLVAAETSAPGALLELRRRLVSRLVTHKRKPAPLRPHLTLARFRAPTTFDLPRFEAPSFAFRVDAICLQSSVLHPDGAEHRTVARAALRLR